MAPVPLVFGCDSVMTGSAHSTPEAINAVFDTLEQNGIDTLDTAQLYRDSETLLGKSNVVARPFTIDSKVPGGWVAGTLEPSRLRADAYASLEKLGILKLDIFYIHGPDKNLPLKDALATMNALHQEGVYSRFGLSNFVASDVQEIYDLCVENNWVRPTVYQGNYSAFARRQETELFPLLRKLGMAFYAYSPLAGGFLARSNVAELKGDGGGKFADKNSFDMYKKMYSEKPALLAGLVRWAEISEGAGCSSPAELAYRWVTNNSILDPEKGDKVIIGASKIAQISKTVEWVKKGPLSPEIVKAINDIWPTIEKESPLDNFNK